jgi:hypothetical protein
MLTHTLFHLVKSSALGLITQAGMKLKSEYRAAVKKNGWENIRGGFIIQWHRFINSNHNWVSCERKIIIANFKNSKQYCEQQLLGTVKIIRSTKCALVGHHAVHATTETLECADVTNLKQWHHHYYYRYALHNDISDDGPHIWRWSQKIIILQYCIIILTIVLQLPTVFSTVTCCTGL